MSRRSESDDASHALNQAYGRGYLLGLFNNRPPPWPPGTSGDQWARGYSAAHFDTAFDNHTIINNPGE